MIRFSIGIEGPHTAATARSSTGLPTKPATHPFGLRVVLRLALALRADFFGLSCSLGFLLLDLPTRQPSKWRAHHLDNLLRIGQVVLNCVETLRRVLKRLALSVQILKRCIADSLRLLSAHPRYIDGFR